MLKGRQKIVTYLLEVSLLCAVPFTVFAKDIDENAPAPEKIVKVGCVDIDNFLVTAGEGYASGYAADYLEKIAEYTGWKYEYIQGSWAECLQWLDEGRIDLLLPAEYSKEREEKFLFSSEMCCMDYAALVGRSDDNSIYYEDYQVFDGMKVGMIEDNYLNQLFDEYARKNHFTVQKVMYPTGTAENQALEKGEVDAIISGNMNFFQNQKLLAKIDFMPAYFVTSKRNQSLMDDLNEAQNIINLENPYYTATLHEKYYGKIERQAVGFTREETEYARNAEALKIFYETDDYPLEYQDQETGEAGGIYLDILKRIFDECGLSFEAVPRTEDSGDWKLAADGEANVVFCTAASPKNKEKYQIEFTDSFFTANYNLVGKRGANVNLQESLRVAVADGERGGRELIETRYPRWETVSCDSVGECLERVEKGQADLAFVNALSQEIRDANGDLLTVSADSISIDICLGLNQKNEKILKAVLDKGMKKLDKHEVEQCVFNYILTVRPQISFSYLVHVYPIQMMIGMAVTFILVVFLIVAYVQSRINKKRNLILQAKNQELKEAIEIQHMLQLECEQDPLTGLKNKKVIEKLCVEKLASECDRQYALLVVDVDNFKNVNDTYGHLMGDQVLAHLAECMRNVFEKQIIGRIGGDEFLILAEITDEEKRLKTLLDKFYTRVASSDLPMEVTCSIGIALSQKNEGDFKALFRKADQALYDAKNSGKNRCAINGRI